MSLRDKVNGIGCLAVAGAFCASVAFGMNYARNDYRYRDIDGVLHASKVDGFLSRTSLERRETGHTQIHRSGDSIIYTDENGDGVVDSVYIGEWRTYEGYTLCGNRLTREEHFSKVPTLFREADKDFKEQLERFGF